MIQTMFKNSFFKVGNVVGPHPLVGKFPLFFSFFIEPFPKRYSIYHYTFYVTMFDLVNTDTFFPFFCPETFRTAVLSVYGMTTLVDLY